MLNLQGLISGTKSLLGDIGGEFKSLVQLPGAMQKANEAQQTAQSVQLKLDGLIKPITPSPLGSPVSVAQSTPAIPPISPDVKLPLTTANAPKIISQTYPLNVLVGLGSGIVDTVARAGVQILKDYQESGQQLGLKPSPFTDKILSSVNPKAIGMDVLQSSGEAVWNRYDELNRLNPPTKPIEAIRNSLVAVSDTLLPRLFDVFITADVIHSLAKVGANTTLSSMSDYQVALKKMGLQPGYSFDELKFAFDNSSKMAAQTGDRVIMKNVLDSQRAIVQGIKDMTEKGLDTSSVYKLNTFGRAVQSVSDTLLKPIEDIGKYTTEGAASTKERLPGYKPINPEVRPMGASIQPIEPVGFGENRVPKVETVKNATDAIKASEMAGIVQKTAINKESAVTKAFDNSTNQKKIGNFELGTFGENAITRKATQPDRFPISELKATEDNIVSAYRASGDTKNYRTDNIAWIAKMPSGETRVIYTRLNKNGAEEIINAHTITNPQFEDTLKSFGTPDQSRTGILNLEGSRPIPLNDGGVTTIPQSDIKTTSQTTPESVASSRELAKTPTESPNTRLPQSEFSSNGSIPQSTAPVKQLASLSKLGLKEKPVLITKEEGVLLRASLRKEAKIAKLVYKEARNTAIQELNAKSVSIQSAKKAVSDYLTNVLSPQDRGKFIVSIRDAKTTEDVAKAFARIDTYANKIEVNKAIQELKKTLSKISDNNAISADYRNKIKDVIENYELSGHIKTTIDKLKATQDFINRQSALGENVEIPQRILDKLKILERIPKDQLTLEQVQGLQNEVELLSKLGETKWASKQALYDAEKALRMKELLSTAAPINSIAEVSGGLEKDPAKYVTAYIKTRNYLQQTRLALTPIEGLADITGMTPMKNVMDANFGNYLSYNDASIKQWYEITKDFDEQNFRRIGVFAMAQQEGGIERLANNGIAQEIVDNLKLTPKEKGAYEFVRKTFDAEFPAVKKYALDVYNKDVGEVKNYVSFMSDNNAMNELEIYDRFGSQPDASMKTKTVEQGFTEQRAKIANTKLELNIDKIFRRHIDDVAYMLTSGRDIKQYFEIVNTPAMREKLGNVGALAWLQYLDLMARKGGSEGAKRIAVLDILRQNLALGVLSFRISSAAIQFTSFADTMATIGAEYAMKGASNISTSKEWRDFVMDNFPEVRKAVGDDIAFREFGDGMLAKLGEKGLIPLQTLDGLMRSTAIAGAYEKLAAEKGITIDFKNPDKELIQGATKLMRHSQGSSFFKDQPLALTTNFGVTGNKSLNKTVLTFQSFMLARWDNMQRQIWRLGIKEKNYKKAIMSIFWMVVVAATMEEGIRRGVKYGISKGTELVTGKIDNTNNGSFLGNSIMNVIQSIPIMGQLVSSMSYSSNPIPTINTLEQILSGGASVWNGKSLVTKIRGGVTTLGAAGSVLGVPGSSQASQIIKGFIPPANSSGGGKGIQSSYGGSGRAVQSSYK